MNCKDKGWKEGNIFKVLNDRGCFKEGSTVILTNNDGSTCPYFDLVEGDTIMSRDETQNRAVSLERVKRIYPKEETVTVTCDGKSVEISRESAKALFNE